MSDKVEQPSVEVTEEVEKTKEEKVVEKPSEKKVENGDVEESEEEPKEKSPEKGAEKKAEENGSEESEDKPAVKRKSAGGGDATDGAAVEGATPEKKAKLDEKESTEAKADAAEVEA